MTDKEKFVALYKEIGIKLKVKTDKTGDKDGKFETQGVFE